MSAILKQKLIDIANGFTKYGLWKGGGSGTLSELTDVTFTDLQANDVLTYNGSVWVNDDNLQKQIDTLNSNLTVITYVFPHGQVLYKQGKIVTVGGTTNWNLVQSIEVPEDFRPLNMPEIPIVSSNGIELTSYSDGIIGKNQTNYWRLFPGISWITN